MEQNIPTREQAYDLLSQYNKSGSLIAHALSVEARKIANNIDYMYQTPLTTRR